MTTSSLPSGGWHTDPSGRHQFRWWDGTRWSDQVADNGVASLDALPAPGATSAAAQAVAETGPSAVASAEAAESLLGRSQLLFRSGGGNFPPAWWEVHDENHQAVGKVWRHGRSNMLCDLEGNSVIGANAALLYASGQTTVQAIRSGDRRIGDLQIVGAAGGELSGITFFQFATSMSMRCSYGDEKKMLTVKMKRSPSGAVKSVELLDRDKRAVGTITEIDRTGNLVKQGTCWYHLERDPGLVDPVRQLAVAAPLLMSSYLFHVGT